MSVWKSEEILLKSFCLRSNIKHWTHCSRSNHSNYSVIELYRIQSNLIESSSVIEHNRTKKFA